MSSLIQNLLCNVLTLSLKAIEFITTKSCAICCQCMRRFPGCFWIIVRILIIAFFIGLSIFLAVFSYIFLYWLLIPSLHYERPIYFDYTLSSPASIINIDQDYEWYLFDLPFEYTKQHQSSLKSNEIYDITINLRIPSKKAMHDIGNVMLKLSLYSCIDTDDMDNIDNHNININKITKQEKHEYSTTDKYQTKFGWNLLRKSSRPILLKYESSLIAIIKKIICIIPYCLGLWNEERYLSIPIMYGFKENFNNPTCAAVIQLSTNKFNIYDATIYFDIQLQGIKYFLYHWWLTSSLFTIIIFTFICCITTSPALMLCCYQVNNIRDCYNNQHINDQEDVEEDIDHNDEDETAPIPLLDDIIHATNTNNNNNNNNNNNRSGSSSSSSSSNSGSRSSSISSTSSSLLLTASPSTEINEDNDTLLINQSGLRRRKKNNNLSGAGDDSNY